MVHAAFLRCLLPLALALRLGACAPLPPAPVALPPPPSWTLRLSITDAVTGQPVPATVLLDDLPRAEAVSAVDLPMPIDQAAPPRLRLRIEAPDYQPFTLELRANLTPGRVIEAPIRLLPRTP